MVLFIVESKWDGVELGKKETNMGQRASDTRGITFTDVRVPVENLVGGVEGQGMDECDEGLRLSRPVVAAQAVGTSGQHTNTLCNTQVRENHLVRSCMSTNNSIHACRYEDEDRGQPLALLEVRMGSRPWNQKHRKPHMLGDWQTCMEITTDAVQVSEVRLF